MLLLLLPLLQKSHNENCVTASSMGVDMRIWAGTRVGTGRGLVLGFSWDGGKPKLGHTLKLSVCVSLSVSENRETWSVRERAGEARRDCL